MKKLRKIAIIMLFSLFISILQFNNVNAASTATMSFSGKSQVSTGETFTLDIVATGISGGGALMSAGGNVTSSNESCVSFVSLTKVATGTVNNNIFAYSDMDGTTSNLTIARVTFKAGSSACSTTVNINSPKLAFTDSTKLSPSTITKTITVGEAQVVEKSSDASLKTLSPSAGTLSPSFSSSTTSYTMEVDSDVNTVTFNATTTDSKATITSGKTCTISSNPTTCTIKVTAEDGTVKNYTVKVSKKAAEEPSDKEEEDKPTEPTKSSDATLKSLNMSGYTLSPAFSKNTTVYSITVANTVTGLDITAVPTDEKATVKISGNTNWKEGNNPVKIVVTAEDGTQKTYTVNVNRRTLDNTSNKVEEKKSTDNYLKDIVISDGIIKPDFNKDTTEYSIVVPNEVTSLDLSVLLSNDKAKYKIEGNENFVTDKTNVVTISVTAEDGSLRVYTINVTRSNKNADTKLKDIIIKGGSKLEPEFDPDVKTYILNDVTGDEIDIEAISENPNVKVEIIGNDKLVDGSNKITILVTDPETGLSSIYTIYANKTAVKKFLGITLSGWLTILGILLLLGFLLLLILLFNKKKEKEEQPKKDSPVIEFKPEFNFGSKNGTDDDIVEAGGVLNQYTGKSEEAKKEAEIPVENKPKEIPYDIYDDVVTKEELLDAIEEAKRTKDSSKLKMLYAQELLNREKARIKEKDKKRRR